MVSFVIGSGGLQVHGGLAVTEEERRYCQGLPLAAICPWHASSNLLGLSGHGLLAAVFEHVALGLCFMKLVGFVLLINSDGVFDRLQHQHLE
jgi:hypothetical protein